MPTAYLDSVSVEDRQQRWSQRLSSQERNALVAETGDRVVAVISWGAGRHNSVELKTLYVDAEYHGTGLAQDLLEQAIGSQEAHLWVFEDNHRAQSFYAGRGFRFSGVTEIDDDTGVTERLFVRGDLGVTRPRHRVELHWGLAGTPIEPLADVTMVIDVLSFSTTVSVACDVGIDIVPFVPDPARARHLATRAGAAVSGGRSTRTASLSPSGMRSSSGVGKAVLMSPNGATLSHRLAHTGSHTMAVCLRNCRRVAEHVTELREINPDLSLRLVAAGERWPDGSLRPAVEDYWGAGAVAAELLARDWTDLSPDARTAAAGFAGIEPTLGDALLGCDSGVELIEAGYRGDVLIAAELNQSTACPVLTGFVFADTRAHSRP